MSWLDSVWGSKPKVAAPRPVTPAQTQEDAINANVKNFADIAHQGDLYSQYLQSAIQKQLPDYLSTLAAGSQTGLDIQKQAEQEAQGIIPQDVQDQIMRSGAYQNLLGGGGDAFLRSLQARDLGLTSLDLIKQGAGLSASNANTQAQWSNLANATIYNPAKEFVTPAQAAAMAQWNEQRRQAAQQARFNVAAAPSPIAKGVSDTLIGLISAYLSKGGGNNANQPASPWSTSVIGQDATGAPVYNSSALPWDSGGGGFGGGAGGGGAGGYIPGVATGPEYGSTIANFGGFGAPGTMFNDIPSSSYLYSPTNVATNFQGFNYDPTQTFYGG